VINQKKGARKMNREEFLKVKDQMIQSGWVNQGTFPKNLSKDGKSWGFKMVRGADTFWLNVDSVDQIPKLKEVEKFDSFQVIKDFRSQFPWIRHGCLSLHKMKKILDGDLVPVRISGKNKFEIWTREDIDSGKLDRLNEEIRRNNRLIRYENKMRQARVNGLVKDHGIIDAIKMILEDSNRILGK
jgi:hypothetical protein